MLVVTDAARDELLHMLAQPDVPEGTAARFVVDDDELRLMLDQPRPGDTKVDQAGRTVLVLDDQVAALLDDKTLDLAEGDQGRGLSLTNSVMP